MHNGVKPQNVCIALSLHLKWVYYLHQWFWLFELFNVSKPHLSTKVVSVSGNHLVLSHFFHILMLTHQLNLSALWSWIASVPPIVLLSWFFAINVQWYSAYKNVHSHCNHFSWDGCCLAFREAKSSGNEDPLQRFTEKTWLVSGIVMMNVAKMVMVEWALVKSGDESRYMS